MSRTDKICHQLQFALGPDLSIDQRKGIIKTKKYSLLKEGHEVTNIMLSRIGFAPLEYPSDANSLKLADSVTINYYPVL